LGWGGVFAIYERV